MQFYIHNFLLLQFIHGKVYIQTGKILRPAKVTFPRENITDTIRRLAPKPREKKSRRKGNQHNEVANSQKDTSPTKTNQLSHGSQCTNTDNSGKDVLKPKAKQRAINTYCLLREKAAALTTPSTKSVSSVRTSRTSKGACLKLPTKGQKSGRSNKGTSLPKTKKVEIKKSALKKRCTSRSQGRNKVADDSLKSPGNSKRRTSSSVSEIVSLPPLERQRVMLDLAAHQNQSNVILQMELSTDSAYSAQVSGVEGNKLTTSTTHVNVQPLLIENKHMTGLKNETFKCKSCVSSQMDNVKCDGNNTNNMCMVHNDTSDEILPCDKSLQIQNIPVSGAEDMDIDSDITTEKHLTKLEPVAQVLSSDETDINSQDTAEISWTKHEDKVILQMFQQDCPTERILHLIGQQIPQRTVEQVFILC